MIESDGNHGKRYVDYPKSKYRTTCLIHGPMHSSDGCKVLGDFDFYYTKSMPRKDYGQDQVNRKKFNSQQENNYIVDIAVDEILLH